MRSVLHRLKGDELRVQYVFVARCRTDRVRPSAEGELRWIPLAETADIGLSAIAREMWLHVLATPEKEAPMVGTLTREGEPGMRWTVLADPYVF